MLSLEDIHEILRTPDRRDPESEIVLQVSNQGTPAIQMQGSDVAEAYADVVARFPWAKPSRCASSRPRRKASSSASSAASEGGQTMGFLNFFLGEKKKTASVAKERPQLILAHERAGRSTASPDYSAPAAARAGRGHPQIRVQNAEDISVSMSARATSKCLSSRSSCPRSKPAPRGPACSPPPVTLPPTRRP